VADAKNRNIFGGEFYLFLCPSAFRARLGGVTATIADNPKPFGVKTESGPEGTNFTL
jgi:hypothetical protein